MEILAPVKDKKSAKVAINSGCDAIYFGASYSARKAASNSHDDIAEIVQFARRRGVKTFMAFNTIIHNEEIKGWFDEINEFYALGIDGVIIQDVAMIPILKKNFPELEVHCSTQMNIANVPACNFVESLGASRVVLPRELNFNNIKYLSEKTKIDLEVFVHGAQCVGWSGNCYHSFLADQKSANRGACSQYCRMNATIFRNDKQISTSDIALNLKDMKNLDNLDALEEIGVASAKIEGRLKEQSYVAKTVSSYSTKNDTGLERVFNRQFTQGLLRETKSSDAFNPERVNNHGIQIGKVSKCSKNSNQDLKYYEYQIQIDNNEIQLGDHLRFINKNIEDGITVEQLKVDGLSTWVYSKKSFEPGTHVIRVKEVAIDDEIAKLENRKTNWEINFQIIDGIPYVYVNDNYINLEFTFDLAEKNALDQEAIEKGLTFDFADVNIELSVDNNYFVPLSVLKKIKNEIIATMFPSREKVSLEIPKVDALCNESPQKLELTEVRNIQEYNQASDSAIKVICNMDIQNESDYVLLPKAFTDEDLKKWMPIFKSHDNFVVSELGSLKLLIDQGDKNIIANFNLNITNNIQKAFFESLGIKYFILSPEAIGLESTNTITISDMRVPTMLLTYCPINLQKAGRCNGCTLCHTNEYYLIDSRGQKCPLIYEGNDKIAVYSSKKLPKVNNISIYTRIGD